MYEPIVSLETGTICGCFIENTFDLLQEDSKYQKFFCRPKADELEAKIRKIMPVDKEKLVIVISESGIQNCDKDMDTLVEQVKKRGLGLAIQIGFDEFIDIRKVKRWKPSFVIVEKSIICQLDSNPKLSHRVNSIVLFGKELDFTVVTGGIETMSVINSSRDDRNKEYQHMSLMRNVSSISGKGHIMLPNEKATKAYELFEREKDCSAICIVDEQGRFQGILTKTNLMHAFGGRYGYNLHIRNTVLDLSNQKTLVVYKNFSIENVSRLAMERSASELYDPVVVLNKDKYFGVVTVKDLLSATVSIEVEKANEANPLTSLPGNKVIEQKIHRLIGENDFFAIIYLDLDNFKAFNDAYGFPNGDRMIEILAWSMKIAYGETSFLGHVGGDDFVIITRHPNVREKSEIIIQKFTERIRELYNDTDWERGYIIAQSRKGNIEQFPIASVSIAVITNQMNKYSRMMELTEQIVTAKKKAKQIEGNSIVVL